MNDGIELSVSKDVRDLFAVAKIDLVNGDVFGKSGNVRAFDIRIVIIVEVIEDSDVMSLDQQSFDKMGPDKTRAAGNENFHAPATSTTKETKCTKKIKLFSIFVC